MNRSILSVAPDLLPLDSPACSRRNPRLIPEGVCSAPACHLSGWTGSYQSSPAAHQSTTTHLHPLLQLDKFSLCTGVDLAMATALKYNESVWLQRLMRDWLSICDATDLVMVCMMDPTGAQGWTYLLNLIKRSAIHGPDLSLLISINYTLKPKSVHSSH